MIFLITPIKRLCFVLLNLLILISFHAVSQTTITFNHTGSAQTWTVPACVSSIHVVLRGAKGGGANGGNGATVSTTLAVTPGQVLQINVGGTGMCPGSAFNGGGIGANASGASNAACGGGGASDIRIAPFALANRIVVAAGGGGMGGGSTDATGGVGGCASGTAGGSPYGIGGYGGTQTAGGMGGPPWISSGNYGVAGTLGNGGAGAIDPCYNLGPGGGGGGGLYGGGGGGSDCFSSTPLGGGGGGGGSSLTPPGGTCTQGNNSGAGLITITYNAIPVVGAITASPMTLCEGQSGALTISGHNGTVQWQSSADGGATWTNIAGATGNTHSTAALFQTTCFRAAVSCGTTLYTNMICITVHPLPVVTATPSMQTICNGQTTNISLSSNISGTNFNWTVSQLNATGATGGSGSTITQILTNTGAVDGTVTYSITPTANNCAGSSLDVIITVASDPSISITPSSPELCSGDTVNVVATGGTNYNWSGGIGAGSAQVLSPSVTTTYSVTGTDPNGCSGTSSVTVTVFSIPLISVTPASPQICQGAVATLTASGGSTYNWSGGIGTGQVQNLSPAATTSYTITGTDTNGCTGMTSVTVTVNVNPVVSVIPVAPQICPGNTVQISASGANSYVWSSGLSAGASQTVSPANTTTYNVTGTDINGCSGTASVTVTVLPDAVINISPASPQICSGNSVTLNASGATSYNWSGTLGSGSSKTVSPTNTTTYTVTGTNSNGCSGSASVTVTVHPNPVISISPVAAQICPGESLNFIATGANTYNWSGGLGSGPSQTVSPVSSTTYTVTGTDINGCTSTSSITVTILTPPVITVTADPSAICFGASSTLTATGAVTYVWSDGLGSGNTQTVSPLVSTTYTVTGTDANGCSSTSQIMISTLPDLAVSITPVNPSVCIGNSILLTAVATGSNPTFNWSTGQNSSSITVSPVVTTLYSVDVTDIYGCSGTAEVTVQVDTIPYLEFAAFPLSGCAPLSVAFQNMSDPGNSIWTFGDGGISAVTNPVHTFMNAGDYSVSLTLTSAQGCENTVIIPDYIKIFPDPVADFSTTSASVDDDWATIFFTDNSVGAQSWYWDFGTGNTNGFSVLQNPEYTYVGEGKYTVWLFVENQWGCSDSIFRDVLIKFSASFYVPNAFSPNGDGLNEVFHPFGRNFDPDYYQMIIYDRFGNEIFKTNNPNIPWDGKRSDSSAEVYPQGIYVYHISFRINGYDKVMTGSVMLVY